MHLARVRSSDDDNDNSPDSPWSLLLPRAVHRRKYKILPSPVDDVMPESNDNNAIGLLKNATWFYTQYHNEFWMLYRYLLFVLFIIRTYNKPAIKSIHNMCIIMFCLFSYSKRIKTVLILFQRFLNLKIVFFFFTKYVLCVFEMSEKLLPLSSHNVYVVTVWIWVLSLLIFYIYWYIHTDVIFSLIYIVIFVFL